MFTFLEIFGIPISTTHWKSFWNSLFFIMYLNKNYSSFSYVFVFYSNVSCHLSSIQCLKFLKLNIISKTRFSLLDINFHQVTHIKCTVILLKTILLYVESPPPHAYIFFQINYWVHEFLPPVFTAQGHLADMQRDRVIVKLELQ